MFTVGIMTVYCCKNNSYQKIELDDNYPGIDIIKKLEEDKIDLYDYSSDETKYIYSLHMTFITREEYQNCDCKLHKTMC